MEPKNWWVSVIFFFQGAVGFRFHVSFRRCSDIFAKSTGSLDFYLLLWRMRYFDVYSEWTNGNVQVPGFFSPVPMGPWFIAILLGEFLYFSKMTLRAGWWFDAPGRFENTKTRWWFRIFFIFTPTVGRLPIWGIFFQMGWFNHQLVLVCDMSIFFGRKF